METNKLVWVHQDQFKLELNSTESEHREEPGPFLFQEQKLTENLNSTQISFLLVKFVGSVSFLQLENHMTLWF